MSKRVEIVSHCYAVKLPLYASSLCYQMSSLLRLPAQVGKNVTLTLCVSLKDESTYQVLEYFASIPKHFKTNIVNLDINSLGRRAIGRNLAALQTDADIVWFSDVDQVFHDGILQRLMELEWPEGAAMIFPRHIMIQRDHELGDTALKKVQDDSKLIDIDPTEFVSKRYGRAIGGVQIVQGDYARKYGYLNKTKWVKPITSGKFLACWCDRIYREQLHSRGDKIVAVDLPGLYRLRHSKAGHGRKPKVRK